MDKSPTFNPHQDINDHNFDLKALSGNGSKDDSKHKISLQEKQQSSFDVNDAAVVEYNKLVDRNQKRKGSTKSNSSRRKSSKPSF